MSPSPAAVRPVPFLLILLCGGAVISIAMGVRQSYGVLIQPLSMMHGWPVATFSLALALQNLLWGAAQPFAAAIAEKYGAHKVGFGAGLIYAVGLALTAWGGSEGTAFLGSGLLVGLALSGTSFGVVLGVIGRAAPPEKRAMALGLGSAMGSLGQVVIVPIAGFTLDGAGVEGTLLLLGAMAVLMAPLSLVLGEKHARGPGALVHEPLSTALARAGRHRGFQLLTLGFFVCGFQVAFVGVHLPGYLATCHMPVELGALALAVIGGFNVLGSWGCGALGQVFRPKMVLSTIYLGRALLVTVFLLLPVTEAGVLVFSALMGLMWLGTVPLTSQIIAAHFGTRYMGTLFGIVFFSHQVGSFTGVWMGGALFDATGSYDVVWWGTVVLGVVAALIHLPIEEPKEPQAAVAA